MISRNHYVVQFLLIFLTNNLAISAKNNVCKNFSDYMMNMDNNPNCWYDPEMYMNSSQILEHRGYKFEQYDVETEDGYFLITLRMPQPETNKRKGVIMMIPPMLSSSDCFIDVGNDSFAYMVWNSGYEVWLANLRGTVYGRRHRKYDPDIDMAFWEFSFHEMGKYDIAASVAYASSISGSFDIIILGYSMSSTAALIYGALRPDHSLKYTKALVLWAPSANMVHTRTITKQINSLKTLTEILGPQGMRDLAPHNTVIWDLLGMCRQGPLLPICVVLDTYFLGRAGTNSARPDWFAIKFAHNPGGVGYRVISHYLQLAENGEFKAFDYGTQGNLKHYNLTKPPFYPVEDIKTPVVLVYGSLDLEAPEIDVMAMYNRLSMEARIYKPIKFVGMHHGGFVYTKVARPIAYIPTIELFNRIYNDNSKDSNMQINSKRHA